MERNPQRIARAFDREARRYARFEAHPTARAMRAACHRVYARYLRSGDHVLDLNCGPGPDFSFFRSRGCQVTGIDLSQRMLDRAARADPDAQLLLLDLNQIDTLQQRFEMICSNFGGLNTQNDFTGFAARCHERLLPRGYLLLNIMTRLPLMEIAEGLVRGRHFFRRMRHGGSQVLKVGDEPLPTWYFHPGGFYRRFFKPYFELQSVTGLGIFLPPPYTTPREGRLFRGLQTLERCAAGLFPFNRLGDHGLLAMRARG